jgi:long-chain fatty acid transport protein
MNYKKTLLATLLAPLFALGNGAATEAHAAGFAIFTHGASALGQGNAVTAHSDNPSTIFYNPALMNRLEGTQFQVGTTAIFTSREFESNLPGGSTSDDAVFFPSTFYATHKFNDKVSAGLGVFNPFGLGTEWADDWEGRYLATKSELTTFNINPVLSYQVTPSLSVAAGVDIILLDATLERKIPSIALAAIGFPPGVDIGQKFEGDGTGVGFNVAVAYDLTKDLTFGASYRSEVEVDIKGDATFSSNVLPVSALNSGGKTEITLPQQVTAALAYKGIDKLTLEAGLRWEGWSSFDKLTITLDNGAVDETPRNWKNSWGANVGAKYQVSDTVALLAGYVWGETAVPDSTFDPSIPDADTHVFCVGTDLDFQAWNIALSYAYQLYEDRTKNNDTKPLLPPANGVYKSDAHLLAMSVGYKF